MKTSENLRFSDVFRGYRSGAFMTLERKGNTSFNVNNKDTWKTCLNYSVAQIVNSFQDNVPILYFLKTWCFLEVHKGNFDLKWFNLDKKTGNRVFLNRSDLAFLTFTTSVLTNKSSFNLKKYFYWWKGGNPKYFISEGFCILKKLDLIDSVSSGRIRWV